jgi:hypothetical protein
VVQRNLEDEFEELQNFIKPPTVRALLVGNRKFTKTRTSTMNFGSIILSPLLALLLYMAQQTPVPATTTTPINRILRQQKN